MNPEWIFFGIGFALFSFGAYRILFGYLSLRWPSIPAEVLSTQIENGSGGVGRQSQTYAIKIKYRYTVKGVEYVGTRFCFGGAGVGSYSLALSELHSETNDFHIFYCPSKPAFSVAKPGIKRDSILLLFLGLLFLLPFFFTLSKSE